MHRRFDFLLATAVTFGLFFLATPARGFILDSTAADPWLTTASGTRSGNGAPATITWSIVPDGTATTTESGNSTAPSNLVAFMNANFGGSPSQTDLTKQPWFHLFTDAFGRWSQLGGVNFVYEPHDDGVLHPSSNGQLGVRGDIRLAGFNIDGPSGTLAFTYIPAGGSDMAIDTSETAEFTKGPNLNYVYFRDTVMHEIGHTFGLEHVSTNESATGKLLMEPFIDDSANPIDGPQLDEVRGVQYFFGDANEKSHNGQGNGTAALATALGTVASGSTRSVGTSANVPTQAISPTATDFVSISNNADVDFYSFGVTQASRINAKLTPLGGVFSQGSADNNQTPTTFNANARSNLALTIFNTNGTSILTTADAQAAGGIETISNLLLPAAGTYYARVTGADDTIQLYELDLAPTAVLLGDYNHDGIVNADDYTIWRRTLGQAVSPGAGADGNFDGQITVSDFTIWRNHFGQTSGSGSGSVLISGAAVPEPGTLCLAAIVVLGGTPIINRRRRFSVC